MHRVNIAIKEGFLDKQQSTKVKRKRHAHYPVVTTEQWDDKEKAKQEEAARVQYIKDGLAKKVQHDKAKKTEEEADFKVRLTFMKIVLRNPRSTNSVSAEVMWFPLQPFRNANLIF